MSSGSKSKSGLKTGALLAGCVSVLALPSAVLAFSTSFSVGKNPIWNLYGHERMGWLLSLYSPSTPAKARRK